MEATLTISLLFLLLGLVVGALSAWLLARFKSKIDHLPKSEVQAHFAPKEVHEAALQQNDLLRDELITKEEQLREFTGQTRAQEQSMIHLREKLEEQRHEMLRLQERFQIEFENVANRLLEEKSQKFSAHNQQQMGELLNPLREKIKTFEENIERRFVEETRDRVSLKKEIEQLRDLNRQLSQDANNLAGALKGDNKCNSKCCSNGPASTKTFTTRCKAPLPMMTVVKNAPTALSICLRASTLSLTPKYR